MLRNRLFTALSLLWLTLLGTASRATAQELLAEVRVTAENVTITDRQLLTAMQNDITQFLNNRRWTNDVYKPEERIRCRIFVGINAIPQNGTYQATARVFTTRPVYGTSYETNVMNYAETWKFSYLPGQPLDFSENSFVNNLSSILSFYAYMMIAAGRHPQLRPRSEHPASSRHPKCRRRRWLERQRQARPAQPLLAAQRHAGPTTRGFALSCVCLLPSGAGHFHSETRRCPQEHPRSAAGCPTGGAAPARLHAHSCLF
jgi:hypothetical protein